VRLVEGADPGTAGPRLNPPLFVPDLQACLAEIASRGIHPEEVERYESGVSKAVFRDPDGNEFGFAGMTTAPG
jgi:hypothetical protein